MPLITDLGLNLGLGAEGGRIFGDSVVKNRCLELLIFYKANRWIQDLIVDDTKMINMCMSICIPEPRCSDLLEATVGRAS